MSGHVIAVDLGAESGRVMRVSLSEKGFALEEAHRFPNNPVMANGTLYWDALRLWHEIQQGVHASVLGAKSIGVDAWGVDYALLDTHQQLISNPIHYRDQRVNGVMERVFQKVSKREIFEHTGLQFLSFNTLYQVMSRLETASPLMDAVAHYVSVPDLFNFWLTGEITNEFTHATTTQFFNPRTGTWAGELMAKLDIPAHWFGDILQPGQQCGSYQKIPVILPAAHDTGSAVVAVPTTTKDYAYISSGTWSLIGLEIPTPIVTEDVFQANLTNEGGVENTYRLLRNVMGLWLAQQSRNAWRAEGKDYSYAELATLAESAEPLSAFIDPDDPRFLTPGDMPARIREFCHSTGQGDIQEVGAVMRVIYESLAFKYRLLLEKLHRVSGQPINRIHVIGGGANNALLCQLTADASNLPVIAGPAEGTALGNAIVQLIALGELGSLAEARALLQKTIQTVTYMPHHSPQWDDAYERFKAIVTTDAVI